MLDPVIRTEFKEVRSYIEYTRAMLEIGEPTKKCSATLMQCRLDGMSDPAFVGLYGGLLYMDSRYDEARTLWDDAKDQGFTYEERIKARYDPRDPSDQTKKLRFSGIVAGVKPSFVFIQPEDGPTVLSATTMVGNELLPRGTKITFNLTFSAKGPFAERVEIVK